MHVLLKRLPTMNDRYLSGRCLRRWLRKRKSFLHPRRRVSHALLPKRTMVRREANVRVPVMEGTSAHTHGVHGLILLLTETDV